MFGVFAIVEILRFASCTISHPGVHCNALFDRSFGANLWDVPVDGGLNGGAPVVLVSRLTAGSLGHHRCLLQHHVLQLPLQDDPHKIC